MPAIWIPKRLVDLNLINTAGLNRQSFIRHCEFEYESRVYAAAKEIIEENRHIIMLTGPSASGKTTTAHKLKDKLINMGKKARVISLDNFFKNKDDYPRLENGEKDYENVTAIELDLFEKCLNELLEKGVAKFPEFDFATETRIEDAIEIEIDDGFIIVEGIHALNPVLLELLPAQETFTIYAGLREEYSFRGQRILPTRDIRLLRRMIRDYKYRGHSPQKTISMWQSVCDGEDKYIKVYKPNADLLLDTSFSYEILLLHSALQDFEQFRDTETAEGQRLDRLFRVFDNIGFIPVGSMPKNSMLGEFFN
ncbi:MAG: adenylyl-sulfate kinase [Oscillospiraceae bacterium]|nr:adenylyl-sulfate kinase [Oscillospiraceae bacterium]